MRSHFSGNYPLTHDEHSRIWTSATVVLDTNALLNLYRYSPDLRQKFIHILNSVSSRLWTPHQVATEFHERRLDIIRLQSNLKAEILGAIDKSFGTLSGKLQEHRKNAFLNMDEIEKKAKSFIEELKVEVSKEYASKFDAHGLTPQKDSVLQAVGELYASKVGDEFTEEELSLLFKEGERRYEQRIPPGFLDARKDGNRKYGDLILWKQIVRYSSEKNVDIMFVTDDAKEDWWWKSQGETLGPLPELRQEFTRETGRIFYSYSPVSFIEKIGKDIDANIAVNLLNEVADTSRKASESREVMYTDVRATQREGVARGRLISKRVIEIRELERKIAEFQSRLGRTESTISATRANLQEVDHQFDRALIGLGRLERDLEELAPSDTVGRNEAEEARESIAYQLETLKVDRQTLQSRIDDLLATRATIHDRLITLQERISSQEFRHLTSSASGDWKSSEAAKILARTEDATDSFE